MILKPAERLNIHRTLPSDDQWHNGLGVANPGGPAMDGAGNGRPGSNYVTSLTWRNLAGRASQRPKVSLTRTDHARREPGAGAPHHVQTTVHKATAVHPLAARTVHFKKPRVKR